MGRYWCQKDPNFKANGKPLQLRIMAAVKELAAEHTFITFRSSASVDVDVSRGQASREIFGAPFTMAVEAQTEGEPDTIVVQVVTKEDTTGAELVVTAHDQSGVFGDLIGIGYTDEDVILEPISD